MSIHSIPVDKLVQEGINIGDSHVLVIQIVRMLPDITSQQWNTSFFCQWVVCTNCLGNLNKPKTIPHASLNLKRCVIHVQEGICFLSVKPYFTFNPLGVFTNQAQPDPKAVLAALANSFLKLS